MLDNTAKPSSGNHVDGRISLAPFNLPPWLAQQSYWAKVEKSEGARRHTRNLFLNLRGRFFLNPDESSEKPAILKSDASPMNRKYFEGDRRNSRPRLSNSERQALHVAQKAMQKDDQRVMSSSQLDGPSGKWIPTRQISHSN